MDMGLVSRMFAGMRVADASATVASYLSPHWSSGLPGNSRDLAGQLVASLWQVNPALFTGDTPLPSRHGLAAASLAAGLGIAQGWPSMEWRVHPIRSALRDLLRSPVALSPSKPVDSLLFVRASSMLSAGS